MSAPLHDIRYAIRSFRRSPGFALAAIITLAVGIGASTAIFSVVDGVLLRPLPYADADRTVVLWQNDRGAGLERDDVSAGNYLEWRDRTTSLERIAAIEPYSFDWAGPDGPQELATWLVTEHFFPIMETRPHLGRTLGPGDYREGVGAVMLSYRTWRDRFGADSSLVGGTIPLEGGTAQVVGVLPPDFQYPAGGELWAPRVLPESARAARAANYFQVVGRVMPETSLEEVRAEMDAIAGRLAADHPDTNAEIGVTVVPLEHQILGSARPAMYVLLAAVFVVLLIACVNVANLLLARGAQRSRELATRAAMGAGRARLISQLAIEHLVLGLSGGALGTLFAAWSLSGLRSLAPPGLPRIDTVQIDVRVLAFAVGVSALTALLFGFAPLLQAVRVDLRGQLGEGGRGAIGERRPVRLRDALVVAQISLALVLLAGAGLLGRSFVRLLQQNPGFETENVVAFSTQAWGAYPDPADRIQFVRTATDLLRGTPGVTAAGISSSLPLSPVAYADRATFSIVGEAEPRPGQEPSARAASATRGYFETLGIPLREGRLFQPTDDADSRAVVVVSEALARRHFPDGDAIGRTLQLSFAGPPVPVEIVGIVGDVRHRGLDDADVAMLYVPHAQHPTGAITFTVRTATSAAGALVRLKERVWSLNAAVALTDIGTLDVLLDDTLRARRFYLFLLGAFSTTALFLAVIGVYGLISYAVRRRASEVGIRLALGAHTHSILGLFLSRAGALILAGVGIGLGASLLVTRYLESLLFEIRPNDPLTLVGVTALIVSVGLVATWVPARRASRIDPARTLRMD